jgi:hypothetical protein
MSKLKSSITKTLTFFSIFDHPLTSTELYRWLWRSPDISYQNFLNQLEQLSEFSESKIKNKDSFYFLQEGQDKIAVRQSRVKLAKKKLDIAQQAASKLRWVPFVKAIFVCNTLALGAVDKDSDIDFFIVAEHNRVWLVRFFANLILKLFRLRVNKNQAKNRVCLSFFTSSKKLNLSEVKIVEPDIYLTYWIDQLVPIYDPENFYNNIQQENNWIKEFLPNLLDKKETVEERSVLDSNLSSKVSSMLEVLWQGGYGNLIDDQAKKLQKKKLKWYLKDDYEDNEPNVIINKNMIKLHKNDRRSEYQQKWQEKLASING